MEAKVDGSSFRESLSNAIGFWEPRRLIYNAALLLVVAARFASAWPESKQALAVDNLLALFILAVLANVAYCAAYLPDVIVQQSAFRNTWLRWRWIVLVVGVLFAGALAYFFSFDLVAPPGAGAR